MHLNAKKYNTFSTVVVILAGLFLFLGLNPQHDDGIVGMTRKNGFGCTCHNLNPNPSVQVFVTGPGLVLAGSTNSYTLTVVGGPAVKGGFNVAPGHGRLNATTSEEKLISGELTHTAPKSFFRDTVSWTFSYQAPPSPGYDTIFSVAQSVNGNGIPDNGDQWNFGDNFLVQVIPSSSNVPLFDEWGIAILTVLFLLAGIYFIERRRRSILPS